MTTGSESLLDRVSRNTAILIAAQIGEKLVNFFLVVLLIRYLPQETFGQYSFVTSFVLLFNVLIGLGFTPLCIREISRSPAVANKVLSAAAVPMGLASLLTLGLVGATVAWSKGDATLVTAALLATFELVLSSYTQLFAAVPRAHERMEFSVGPQLVRTLLVFFACLILIPRGLGLVGVFIVIAVAGGVRLLLQVLVARSVFGIALARFDAQFSKRLLRQAYPLAIASVFVIIYYKIDAVMISYMLGDASVGLYTAASTLAFAPFFVAQAFHQATFPLLTKIMDQPGERLARAYGLSIKYLALAGLPIVCGLTLLAPRFILLVYDDRYLDAAEPLRILAGAMGLMFVNGFIGNTLIAMNRQKILMYVVAVGAVVNVALNSVAIPRFGLIGAASATVLSEVIAGAAIGYAAWRERGLAIPGADLIKLLIATAAMGAFVIWAQSLPLLFLVPSSAAVYAALLLGSGIVDRDELYRIGAIINRRAGI